MQLSKVTQLLNPTRIQILINLNQRAEISTQQGVQWLVHNFFSEIEVKEPPVDGFL